MERRDTLAAVMKNKISSITIGLDLGDNKHVICVPNKAGEIIDQRAITTHRVSAGNTFPNSRVASSLPQI